MPHTPGPWEASKWRVTNYPDVRARGVRMEVICDTASNKATRTPENEANARLIAAAPTMLDALEHVLARAESYGDEFCAEEREMLAVVLGAIERAKGQEEDYASRTA